MTWICMTANATDEAIDWIRTLLAEIQYAGEIRITSRIDSMQPESESSIGTLQVQLYLPNDAQSRLIIDSIEHHLASLSRTGMMSEWQIASVPALPVDPQSTPLQTIGRFVIVSPAAMVSLHPDQIPLRVGQGLAFGSGFHPATILCLRLLEQFVTPGMKTLDLGCGSGILSVAMAKMGAQVTAIDNDAIAIYATQTTLHQNQVMAQVTTLVGSLGQGSQLGHWMGGDLPQAGQTLQPTGDFDLIVANLFARIHLSLVYDYHQALKQTRDRGGILITAGYDTDYEQEIDHALQQVGLRAIACERLDNWLAFAHQFCG